MKIALLSLSFLLISTLSFSQTKKPELEPYKKSPLKVESKSDCYIQWYNAFQKYGAEVVPDGSHEVVISLCKNGACTCYMGKVEVKGGEIQRYSVYILQEDGTYERPNRTLSPKYNNPEGGLDMRITDGMSPAFLTSQEETVYIMFYKSLSKVPKKPKKAPTPAELNIK